MGRIAVTGSQFVDALCAEFNGVDEYCSNSAISGSGDSSGAYCLRVRLGSLLASNGAKGIFGVRSSVNGDYLCLRQYRGTPTSNQNRLQILKIGTGAANLYANAALTAGSWLSVVLQSNGSSYEVYLNAVLQVLAANSGTNSGAWHSTLSPGLILLMGAQPQTPATLYNDCRIDEVIYVGGRMLTGAEISEWHNAGVPFNPHRLSFRSDIDSWWRFGDSRDDATTIYDEIGSNHLTLVNMDASNYVAA